MTATPRVLGQSFLCGLVAGLLLGVGIVALCGCGPITIELMPKHYHDSPAGRRCHGEGEAAGADALESEYVNEQIEKLIEKGGGR